MKKEIPTLRVRLTIYTLVTTIILGATIGWQLYRPQHERQVVAAKQAAAFQSLLNKAKQNDHAAQYALAQQYLEGPSVHRDVSKAVYWYEKAAEGGNPRAQNKLGILYEQGNGVDQNDATAIQWYTKAAEANDIYGLYNLAQMYEHGRGVDQDYGRAAALLRKAADMGNPESQHALATLYYYGEGVPKDVSEAVKWLRKAADQGSAASYNNLAKLYMNGEGVRKDLLRAGALLKQAADGGYHHAAKTLQQNVTTCTDEEGPACIVTAGAGDAEGELVTGTYFERGLYLPLDKEKAVFWYRKSAEQDNAKAQAMLAKALDTGDGVPVDHAQAYAWFFVLSKHEAETPEDKVVIAGAKFMMPIILAKLSKPDQRVAKQEAKDLLRSIKGH